MRQLVLFSAVLLGAFLVGCGGGSPGTAAHGGSVTGEITSIDSSTSALQGVSLRMVETGEMATSAADGSFGFALPSPRSFTLALVSARALRKADDGADDGTDDGMDDGEHEGEHDAHEDEDDGDEASEDEVEVHRVEDGEHVHVRVEIRDGKIDRVDISRSSHDEEEVEVFLDRAATSDDPDIKGKIEVEVRDDRQRLEIEVEHAAPGRMLEAVVIAPDGAEASLGALGATALGEAEWEINTGDGGALPFGAGSVSDLEGFGVEVRDAAAGTVLLSGTVPAVPSAP